MIPEKHQKQWDECNELDKALSSILVNYDIGIGLMVMSRICAMLIEQAKCPNIKGHFLGSFEGFLKEYTKDE